MSSKKASSQSGTTVPTEIQYMGYHLQSDVAHDFTKLPTDVAPYNVNGANAMRDAGATKLDEDACVNFFIDGVGKSMIQNFDARRKNEFVFVMPDKTASFKEWKAPVLYEAGNDKIGIVQDAGEFITTRLGAQNVLTFGSVLDPAGKPKDKNANPIWYDPSSNTTLTIPLYPFGFDRQAIESIEIKDFSGGGLVSAVFQNENIDAVRMTPVNPKVALKKKPLNNTAIENAGFFTSIAKANDIDDDKLIFPEEALKAFKDRKAFLAKYRKYFFIGKTLGDTMLVASAMPMLYDNNFQPTIPNTFLNTKDGKWKDWVTGNGVTAPGLLILKTGDRLNWLRAVLFNVGAIYEDQAKQGRSVKQYRYFPGQVNEEAVITSILNDFEKIKANLISRYRNLAVNIRKLDLVNTTFAPGGMNVLIAKNVQVGKQLLERIANELIQYTETPSASSESSSIINVTGGVCKVVVDWIAKRKTAAGELIKVNDPNEPNKLEKLRKYYNETLSKANACSPQVNTLMVEKKNQPLYFASKVIVAGVPLKINNGDDWPLQYSIDIALRGAFSKISSKGDYAGTDIDTRFFNMLPGPTTTRRNGGQRGGDKTLRYVPLDQTIIDATANEMVGPPPAQQVDEAPKEYIDVNESISGRTGGGQTGGASAMIIKYEDGMSDDPNVYYPLLKERGFPRIRDFMKYMEELDKIKTTQLQLLIIYDVVRNQNSLHFHDPLLLEELVEEFMRFCGIPVDTTTLSRETTGQLQAPAAAGAGPAVGTTITSPTKYITVVKNRDPAFSFVNSIRSREAITTVSDPMKIFNAYSCNVDAQNSVALFGPASASAFDFIAYEQSYLKRLPYRSSRRGEQVAFSVTSDEGPSSGSAAAGSGPQGRRTGGLRTRRPLYTK